MNVSQLAIYDIVTKSRKANTRICDLFKKNIPVKLKRINVEMIPDDPMAITETKKTNSAGVSTLNLVKSRSLDKYIDIYNIDNVFKKYTEI